LIFLFALSVICTSSNLTIFGRTYDYQFSQLNPYYQNSLFGVKFDYNRESSPSQSLRFLENLIYEENFTDQVDPDPSSDTNVALIGHNSYDIQSAFLAVESIKRTETITYPLFRSIEWQTSLPFVKYLIEFKLPSGENAILSQDLLGIALKVGGLNFNPDYYQVGFANIPLDFLEFLASSLSSGQAISLYSNTTPMTIDVHESKNAITVTTTYTNITYLFQINTLDFEQLLSFELSDHFLLAQFDSISISVKFLKYSKPSNSGVETQINIQIGNILNLIINEALPTPGPWLQSTEESINVTYGDLFEIDETFSWYKHKDINKRLAMFDNLSFSCLLSQNLAVLNGTNSIDDLQIAVAGETISDEDLKHQDIIVQDNITISRGTELLYNAHIKGYDYVLNKDPITGDLYVTPLINKLISINQHPSLSNNIQFSRETSLLNELIADNVRRFLDNNSFITLGTDQLLKIANLYLTSSVFIQGLENEEWRGNPFSMKFHYTAIKEIDQAQANLSNITNFAFLIEIIPMLIITRIGLKKYRIRRNQKK
jgi:hypothetical protein